MSKVRVSAVKYTNSIPFIYGLQNSPYRDEIELSLDTPADCYHKLKNGSVDIGLVPVIIKNELPALHAVTNYGIASHGDVHSVILVSSSPLRDTRTIILDYQSRTSVMLTRLLCRDYWKITPEFRDAKPGFEDGEFKPNEARLIIGDRSFPFHANDKLYITDLSGEWNRFTGKSFVFAYWASVNKLSHEFEQKFNAALSFGLEHKAQQVKDMQNEKSFNSIDLHKYLFENIIHEITPSMREGMNLFLHLIRDFH